MQILKLLLLTISLGGYFLFINEKKYLKTEYIPMLVFSSIVFILFFAGLLNILLATSSLIYMFGIGLAIYEIKNGNILLKIKRFCTLGTVFFIGAAIIGLIIFRGRKLAHYDNFSHWALIVKDMLINNKLPNFTSSLIEFQSYPPASALWIYFIGTFIGNSEGIMIFAQFILMASALTTLFSFVNKNNKYISFFVISLLNILLLIIFKDSLTSLLVDGLLPIVAISCICVILDYKDDIIKCCLILLPLNASLILIKNSGYFFLAINAILLMILIIKNYKINNVIIKKQKYVLYYCLSIIIPLLSLYLWSRHVKYVFYAGIDSKHSVSISNYKNIFSEKSFETINTIIDKFIKITFSINYLTLILIITIISAVIMCILLKKLHNKKPSLTIKMLILGSISVILFLLSILATYIFSMPTLEALSMPSFYRYFETIVIYFVGIIMLGILYEMMNIKFNNKMIIIIMSLCLITNIGLTKNISAFTNKNFGFYGNNYALAQEVAKFVDKYAPNTQDGYYIYLDSEITNGYDYYVCKYYLYINNIKIITAKDLEDDIIQTDNRFSKLLVVQQNDYIKKYIREKFNNNLNIVIGIYELT